MGFLLVVDDDVDDVDDVDDDDVHIDWLSLFFWSKTTNKTQLHLISPILLLFCPKFSWTI